MAALATLTARGHRHARAERTGRFRALIRYFRDPDASVFGKAFVLFAIAYVVMPLDLIPDVAPVIGWLDDAGIASVALLYLSFVTKRYRESPSL